MIRLKLIVKGAPTEKSNKEEIDPAGKVDANNFFDGYALVLACHQLSALHYHGVCEPHRHNGKRNVP